MNEKIEFLEKQIDNKTLGQVTAADMTFILLKRLLEKQNKFDVALLMFEQLLQNQNELLGKITAIKQPEVKKDEPIKKNKNFLQRVFT